MKNSNCLVVSNIKQETVDSVVVSFKVEKKAGLSMLLKPVSI
jgi:hypothetical protein